MFEKAVLLLDISPWVFIAFVSQVRVPSVQMAVVINLFRPVDDRRGKVPPKFKLR